MKNILEYIMDEKIIYELLKYSKKYQKVMGLSLFHYKKNITLN
jgi:hypothetical protein